MTHLTEGVRRFQDSVYSGMQSLFEKLAKGQEPHTLFITCADSRIDPSLITQTEPGQIFVHRNAGNLVPKSGGSGSSEAASIEFAVCGLGVKNIVVCGHSDCGAMKGVANPESLSGLDHVASWLENASETADAAKQIEPGCDDPLMALVERNVAIQLNHLLEYPLVQQRVEAGELTLSGWVYSIGTGEVRVYQRGDDCFVSLADLED